MDGGKWDHVEETIKDTPHRFNQLPHFLCKLIIKVFFFKNAQALLNSSNKTDLFYQKHRISIVSSENDDHAVINPNKNKFKCPVYRNSSRAGSPNEQARNFVTAINIYCNENPEFWVLRGLCMILENDD